MRALCVSIHDVAPQTLPLCRTIATAVGEIDSTLPLTLLVVPCYHGHVENPPVAYREWIGERLARGDALALHGFTHRDDAPAPRGIAQRLRRRLYTAGEGEFAALSRGQAAERLARGRRWLAAQGWQADGFIAPAWLLSDGAWRALRDSDFLYTATLTHFHVLKPRSVLAAPTVVYSAHSAWRRLASRMWNAALVAATRDAELVRVGFHPADAQHPRLLRHALVLLERLRRAREALTKADAARLIAAREMNAATLMHRA